MKYENKISGKLSDMKSFLKKLFFGIDIKMYHSCIKGTHITWAGL